MCFYQASHSSSLPSVPGGHAQMASMPPESVLQETDQPPPYSGHAQCCSQGADLLLVPLDMSVMPSPESVVQETSRPPPYTGDTQNCTQGPDLQLVPLEMTPMPPQEIDPPPPYHQISTTESDMWSLHDGDQPPPYSTCTEQQVRVKYFVSLFRKLIYTLPFKMNLLTKFLTCNFSLSHTLLSYDFIAYFF